MLCVCFPQRKKTNMWVWTTLLWKQNMKSINWSCPNGIMSFCPFSMLKKKKNCNLILKKAKVGKKIRQCQKLSFLIISFSSARKQMKFIFKGQLYLHINLSVNHSDFSACTEYSLCWRIPNYLLTTPKSKEANGSPLISKPKALWLWDTRNNTGHEKTCILM